MKRYTTDEFLQAYVFIPVSLADIISEDEFDLVFNNANPDEDYYCMVEQLIGEHNG